MKSNKEIAKLLAMGAPITPTEQKSTVYNQTENTATPQKTQKASKNKKPTVQNTVENHTSTDYNEDEKVKAIFEGRPNYKGKPQWDSKNQEGKPNHKPWTENSTRNWVDKRDTPRPERKPAQPFVAG